MNEDLLRVLQELKGGMKLKKESVKALLTEKGLPEAEICVAVTVNKSVRARDTREFLSHLHHLAEEHDILEAAEAETAILKFLLAAETHLVALDEKCGTKLSEGRDDLKRTGRLVEDSQKLLDSVRGKHELVKSVS